MLVASIMMNDQQGANDERKGTCWRAERRVGAALCASAQAQNNYSFLDAAKSPINYSLANATPQMKCADLRALSTTDVTIIYGAADRRLRMACRSIAASPATSFPRSPSR